MNKAPVYMIKYHNKIIDRAMQKTASETEKNDTIRKASNAVRYYELGVITEDEAMQTLVTASIELNGRGKENE